MPLSTAEIDLITTSTKVDLFARDAQRASVIAAYGNADRADSRLLEARAALCDAVAEIDRYFACASKIDIAAE